MQITALYAGLLGFLLLALSIRVVVVVRGGGKVTFGDGGRADFTGVVRAQGNFIEYVPMALLLMGLVEYHTTGMAGLLHTLGILLVAGRIAHAVGLSGESGILALRVAGALSTWFVIAVASLFSIYGYTVR